MNLLQLPGEDKRSTIEALSEHDRELDLSRIR